MVAFAINMRYSSVAWGSNEEESKPEEGGGKWMSELAIERAKKKENQRRGLQQPVVSSWLAFSSIHSEFYFPLPSLSFFNFSLDSKANE